MAEFYVSLTTQEMARQVAAMINGHNRWYTQFTAARLMNSSARYFVEINGPSVVGCAGHQQEYPNLTKIQHICVLPAYRRRGIARKLTTLAIDNCPTEYVYMTIREDNVPSLRLAETLGFEYVQKHWYRDHWTLTFGRKTHDCRERSSLF